MEQKIILHRIGLVNARLAAKRRRLESLYKNITRGLADRSADESFALLYDMIDSTAQAADGINACRRGCSHCCHIGVGLSTVEADVIARRIGVAREDVPHRDDFADFPYGYENPCTFLKNGECSIYDARPVACRSQINMGTTPEPCELTEAHRGVADVPYLNMRQFTTMAVMLAVHYGEGDVSLGELRDFFPKGRGDD